MSKATLIARALNKIASTLQDACRDWARKAAKKLSPTRPAYGKYKVMGRFWAYHPQDAKMYCQAPAEFQEQMLQDQPELAKAEKQA